MGEVYEAADIILQIIDDLAAAHAAGIIHCDIKTSNCFLVADGSVKIGDYGLSIPARSNPFFLFLDRLPGVFSALGEKANSYISDYNQVQVTILSSAAGGTGKVFARMSGMLSP